MSIAWKRLPFSFTTPADYDRKLSAWIGQAFYERLPAAGYQVREEQIYFSFRVAAALGSGRPILAEAGSGTGKTFAYLLPAVCHARLQGRPVVVATATAALSEQLAGSEGDVATLSRILDLDIDARVAHRPEDVLCDLRLERWATLGRRQAGRAGLLRWAEGSRHGARSEFPAASDELWARVAWDRSCRCDLCPRRGYCRLTRGREHARAAADLVVCGHDLFLHDTLARDRLPPGRLPVVPPFSAVVFDEGHRVALAAQRAAGSRLRPAEVTLALQGVGTDGARERLLRLAEAAEGAAEGFFAALRAATSDGSGRRAVAVRSPLAAAAATLDGLLERLQDEMAIEQGLHEESSYAARLDAFHTWLDAARATLSGLSDPAMVPWVEGDDLWVAPRDLGPLWRDRLPPRTPVAFSSATLSVEGSFDYAAASLGLDRPLTARVGVPFRLGRQVLCYLPAQLPDGDAPSFWVGVAPHLARLLQATGGRALVLVPGPDELLALREALREGGYPVLWEGDAAPERLVAEFADVEASCLVTHSLWEGIDVPGAALSAVVIPQLPLPGADPVVQARRDAALAAGRDPFLAVDVPDMTLRCKQGAGRLIRTESDRGIVAVLDGRAARFSLALDSALPEGARRVRTLAPVRRFLAEPGREGQDGTARKRGRRPGG